jgi:hypothetical protein
MLFGRCRSVQFLVDPDHDITMRMGSAWFALAAGPGDDDEEDDVPIGDPDDDDFDDDDEEEDDEDDTLWAVHGGAVQQAVACRRAQDLRRLTDNR